VRAAIEAHHGHVFKTIGDAFCAAFARPPDAIAALLAVQRALCAEDFSAVDGLRVRAALHTGTAEERDGDYFGPTLNRVARLLAIAHGGQVVVSGAAASFADGALPADASLRDLGDHRLKDLTRPERVFQLCAAGLDANFPPLRSLGTLLNNLPQQSTSLIGREAEVAAIAALVAAHRLVTLVGSGGIGKTRTSLQVAADLLDGSGDGVWFIELAPLASAAYLPTAIAQVLQISLPPGGDPTAQLVAALRGMRALLVLDNCEHVLDGTAALCAALLRDCPSLKILASSRESLGIAGEQIFRLPSLPVARASDGTALTAASALASAAVELFVARARAADDRFTLTDDNAATVAEICRRLDGIPLALELAAARVRILGPRQLSRRLDERFRVLTGGRRDALPRQQTLRALIDWSHDLLDDRERVLFRRLGIFVSEFSLEGAVAVGSAGDLDEYDVVDLLVSLVDKSLIVAETAGEGSRYHLLESTRAYAAEKLAFAGERDAAAARHLSYLRVRFADVLARVLQSARPRELEELFALELDDVRAALGFALLYDVTGGAELLAGIDIAWSSAGLRAECLERCAAFLAVLPASQPALRASLLAVTYDLTAPLGRLDQLTVLAAELGAAARASADPDLMSEAYRAAINTAALAQQFEAGEAASREAASLPPASKLRRHRLEYARGYLAQQRGDLATASAVFRRLLEHLRDSDATGAVGMLLNLAEVEHARGHTAEAIALAYEALPRSRAGKDRRQLALLLTNLTGYALAVNDIDGGVRAACEAIRELAAIEVESPFIAVAIEHRALAVALRGDLRRAAELAGYAGAVLAEHGLERAFTERASYDRLQTLLAAGLPAAELAARIAQGAARPADAAVAVALADDPGDGDALPSAVA
jgi:predicted ATPase